MKLKKIILIAALLLTASIFSGAVNWVFQFVFICLSYFYASYFIFTANKNKLPWYYILILIVPFVLVYGSVAINNSNTHTYPIIFAPIIGFLLSKTLSLIKRYKWVALPVFGLIIGVTGAIAMKNWLRYDFDENGGVISERLNPVELYDINQSDYQFEKGKIYIVDVWSTSCGWCIEEFPTFEAKKKEYAHDNELVFLTLNLPTRKDLNDYEKRRKPVLNYAFESVFAKNADSWKKLKIDGVPNYLIIDKNLTVRYRGYFNSKWYHFVNNIDDLIKKIKNEG
jgi:thiol-disulfide isomerase/thioredoxin